MGFKVPRRTARVAFEEGHDYHGAEIVLRLDLPVSALFEMQHLREGDSTADEAIRRFADEVIESWNIEGDDGQPLPVQYEGGASTLPAAFIIALMDRWSQEATAAPAPLGQPSSDTAGSVVPLTQTGT